MELKATEERIENLREKHRSFFCSSPEDLRAVIAPFRACPLGAHVDHQLGIVTGMAIENCIILIFAPNLLGRVNLVSLNFPGSKSFSLRGMPRRVHDWSDYARGAVMALSSRFPLQTGIDAILEGNLPIGGLSSSAAAGVAYLLALEAANGLELSVGENIELDRIIENDFITLDNGILDQSVILLSEEKRLLSLDCLDSRHEHVEPHPETPAFDILVVYSGVERRLIDTEYNKRVQECEAGARLLLERAGRPVPPEGPVKLRQADPGDFERFGSMLPLPLRKRAEHFFSECRRVVDGLQAWRHGDLSRFGKLMQESGLSSIRNYECGSPPLISLTEILNETSGVYGARFSGAGFRGSCVGLSDPARREVIRETAQREYSKRHPEFAPKLEVHFCRRSPGARLL